MVSHRTLQPEIQRVQLSLDTILSAEELASYADRAAKLDEELFDKREALSAYQKAAKAEMDEITRDRSDCLRKVRTRREERKVACQRTFDFTTNAVITTRLDSGEVVDTRAMTYDERQQHLFEIPGAGTVGADTRQQHREQADFDRSQREGVDDGSEAEGDAES